MRIEVPAGLRAVVDVQAFDRILSNLLANAVRHGAPPFFVSAARTNGELSVTIEDRGSGVAEEFVGSLFERFTRGATPSSAGAGLGLSIAQSYARAHGGTLTYEPAKPHGPSPPSDLGSPRNPVRLMSRGMICVEGSGEGALTSGNGFGAGYRPLTD